MPYRLETIASVVFLALAFTTNEAPARKSGSHSSAHAHSARRGSIPIYVYSPYVYTPFNYTDIDNPNCPLVRLGVKTDNGLRWARACPR